MMRTGRVLVAILGSLLIGCEDAPPTGPTRPLGDPPTARVTAGFGEAPLSSELILSPRSDAEVSYTVDWDGDGSPDERGALRDTLRLSHVFADVGVHPIELTFRQGTAEATTMVHVVVNDPSLLRKTNEGAIVPRFERLEGIAMAAGDEALYVSHAKAPRIHRVDPDNLESEISVVPPARSTLEGLGIDPSGERLYVVSKHDFIGILSLPDLGIVGGFSLVPTGGAGQTNQVRVARDGTVLVSGDWGVGIVDVEQERLLRSHVRGQTGGFDLDPLEERIAMTENGTAAAPAILRILDRDLQEIVVVPLPHTGFSDTRPAFSPDGEVVYVVGDGDGRVADERFLFFTAVEAESGAILQDLVLPYFGKFFPGVANPVAKTADGRYVAFAMGGILLIDTRIHLPVAALSDVGGDVAASRVSSKLYSYQFPDGELVELTIGN